MVKPFAGGHRHGDVAGEAEVVAVGIGEAVRAPLPGGEVDFREGPGGTRAGIDRGHSVMVPFNRSSARRAS